MTETLPETTLERMLHRVEPEWTLDGAEPVESGFSEVYRLDVAGDVDTCYLKCTTDGNDESIPPDARIQRVLEVNTDIPVTPVLGVVDDHPDLPAPYHLTAAVPGESLPYEAVGRLSDDVIRGVTRDVGRHLGSLHTLDAVDSFGYVASAGPSLGGERPAGTTNDLTTVRGRETWPEYLRARTNAELDRHADSRFGGLTERLESWFDERITALSGPFEPRLGRNDHGFHNLLVDPDAGRVRAMPDWAYTLAVPPSFDFEFAAYLYGGSFLAGLPEVRDRRELVRQAMLEGYAETAPTLVDRMRDPTPCYEMLAAVRVMNDFHYLEVPQGTDEGVAERLQSDIESVLDG